MSWRAVVAALDAHEQFHSRISVYLHPLGGRPIVGHVLRALVETTPPPSHIRVLHRSEVPITVPTDAAVSICAEPVAAGAELRALRAAVTPTGMTVLVDGAAPLVAPPTVARLLRAGEIGVATLLDRSEDASGVAAAGEGPALAAADDPRRPAGATPVAPTEPTELLRVIDRQHYARAAAALRDRLVRRFEAAGVTFLLPQTVWIDVDARIGPDTLIYPGTVIEGATEIGAECVIGPCSRIVEAHIGRGVELKGWNYVTRTSVRNHAVLEPYVRRGYD
jgi:bifunctional N-acetylglucosamine-1-phosphate-uridyltransferase/glucosamine-1-phosphate-acetyltransferase GlmU-like protein